jgi:hypothetical protein
MANTGCRSRRWCWAATNVRSGSRPGGCPGPMRRSGSEEIGSPSRVRITGAGGVLASTGQNKRAYISLVNSRAEALGYKTRKIARLLLPGAPNGFSSRDTRFCLRVQVSYPSSSSQPHPTASASSCTSPARRSRPMSKKLRFLMTANNQGRADPPRGLHNRAELFRATNHGETSHKAQREPGGSLSTELRDRRL